MVGMEKKIGPQLGIRLDDDEVRRLQSVIADIERKHYGFIPTTEIVKELIGLKPQRFVTEAHRARLLETSRKL